MGYVASNFVSPATTSYLQSLLRNDTGDYLAGIATWADSIRYTKWGRFTSDFHFIDSKDDPPRYCGVDFERDCKKDRGCVVSALSNYTLRMLDEDGLPERERADAAKFVVHFVGDIHQPLHAEDVARGGNGIPALFDGRRFNLHHVWDTSIAEKLVTGGGRGVGRKPYPAAKRWADELTREINEGKYASERIDWLRSANLSDPIATAMAWAAESNAYVCTTGKFLFFFLLLFFFFSSHVWFSWLNRVYTPVHKQTWLICSQSCRRGRMQSETKSLGQITTKPLHRWWKCRSQGRDIGWLHGWI